MTSSRASSAPTTSRGYVRSGYELVDQLRDLLERSGYDLGRFRDVYDFGSGPGRLARALHERLPEARVTATDIDEEAIDCLAEHAPGIDVRVSPGSRRSRSMTAPSTS